jgi:ABC-2 type transport system permease protein
MRPATNTPPSWGATAAIVALAFTLGCWMLDFAAATQTGLVRDLAALSLTAALRSFERGLVGSPQLVFLLSAGTALLAITAVWLPTGQPRRQKLLASAGFVALAIGLTALAGRFPIYLDLTEDRRNSLNPADERALRAMSQELRLTIYLAPEDSRLRELERNLLGKLRRVVPHLTVQYADTGKSGRFGTASSAQYGLIQYDYAGKHDESRSTSAAEVLPLIHALADQQVTPDPSVDYRGYPLVADANPSAVWFYLILPGLFAAVWWLSQRPPRAGPSR